MGILDFLGKYSTCKACGQRRAWSVLGKIKCQNMSCVHFDREFADRERSTLEKRRTESAQSRPREGNFDPGEYKIDVRYTNYLGVEGASSGGRRTIWRTKGPFSLLLCPTGRRVSFARARILNLNDLEQGTPAGPTAREKQVLNYHKSKGTSSALFEEIRKKYPDY